jgi:hypothetical protein
MSKPKRPWLVMGYSNEGGWNERVGRRFTTEARAIAFADQMREYGWWAVRVLYSEVRP